MSERWAIAERLRRAAQSIVRDGRSHYQLMRYGLIGVLSNAVFFAVANISFLATQSSLLSSMVGWVFALFISFFGHGYFTYMSECDGKVFVKFLVLAIWNLAVVQIITVLGSLYFEWPYWLTSLCIVLVVPLFSFFAGRYLVFKPNTRDRFLV